MIYLNNAASTYPKPDCVETAVLRSLREPPSDAARGGRGADPAEACRRALAKVLGVAHERNVFFTSGATESFNLLLRGLDIANKRVGVSAFEHNALLKPLYSLAPAGNIRVLYPGPDGDISASDWEAGCKWADIMFVNHCSNVTGQVQDIARIAGLCHSHGSQIVCDLSQSAGLIPLDLDGWQVDAAVFTGHKALFGPSGTGGFFCSDATALNEAKWGGTGDNGDSLLPINKGSRRFEVGTQNLSGIAGLAAGVGYVLSRGADSIFRDVAEKTRRIHDALSALPGIKLYGPESPLGIVSFNVSGLLPADTAYILANVYDITVRAGFHCAPLAAEAIGAQHGTVRLSVSCLTPDGDISAFLNAMRELCSGMDAGR